MKVESAAAWGVRRPLLAERRLKKVLLADQFAGKDTSHVGLDLGHQVLCPFVDLFFVLLVAELVRLQLVHDAGAEALEESLLQLSTLDGPFFGLLPQLLQLELVRVQSLHELGAQAVDRGSFTACWLGASWGGLALLSLQSPAGSLRGAVIRVRTVRCELSSMLFRLMESPGRS
eukprot:CAMPEP_0170501744 /NCGR_PEP_ID=MMETSP0208-20121228/39284_1 /TAXON_ID=197538 /ORGANISM="Strombidium inclinatum, Strain S3" /LENGTH=173 /DNA_ID=CAMNT_0010780441 /DNA_START=396 /DNA_END=914 /DNA_ORIENTATION=+